mgnify:CR=1 FL=1
MEFSIDRLAQLARLQLSKEEEKKFESDLERILTYADQLREIDTNNVEEIIHTAPEINVLRADVLPEKKEEENTEAVAALRNTFPESEEGYIRVPLVINKK